jgi:small subunit ribosomal protein S7
MTALKIFNRWTTEGINVDDLGLKAYITLNPRIVPKTGARYAGNKFHKSNITIVERLINKVMVPGHKSKKHNKSSGHITGMASKAYNIVEESFNLIEAKTKENPIAVFVKAVETAAAREEIVTIEYGGARYPKAVECSPQRRIDIALRHMTQGAYAKSFNAKKGIVNALADEIISAYQCSPSSNAIAKKNELERQADASR